MVHGYATRADSRNPGNYAEDGEGSKSLYNRVLRIILRRHPGSTHPTIGGWLARTTILNITSGCPMQARSWLAWGRCRIDYEMACYQQ